MSLSPKGHVIDDSAGDRVGLLDVGEMGSIGDNYKLGAANSSSF